MVQATPLGRQRPRPDCTLAHEQAGSGAVAGVTRLQKLLFLTSASPEYATLVSRGDAPRIEFEPYRMGPFTPEIYDAIQVLAAFTPPLVKASNVADEEPDQIELARYVDELDLDLNEPPGSPPRPTLFELTADGRRVADWIWSRLPNDLSDVVRDVERDYGRLPLRELLRRVYERFPAMTTRSEIKGQLGLPE